MLKRGASVEANIVRRAVKLYTLGEISAAGRTFMPRICFLKRRFYFQLELEIDEWVLAEFETKEKFYEALRQIFPNFPKLSIYEEGLINDAKAKVTIFGWRKRYKKQRRKLGETMKEKIWNKRC